MRFSFCKTFSQLIDKNDLPATIRRTLEGKETAEEQDKIILADLNLLAIAEPNVYGIYGEKRVFTPFYLFILGLAGISHKGVLDDLKQLLMPIDKHFRAQYYAQLSEYKEQPQLGMFVAAHSYGNSCSRWATATTAKLSHLDR